MVSAPSERVRRRATAALVLLLPLALVAFLAARAMWATDVPFLGAAPGAAWVLYPSPPQTALRRGIELEAEFRLRFALGEPSPARLALRAFRGARATLDGAAVPLSDVGWRGAADVSLGTLSAGEHELVLTVVNAQGPPCLWARVLDPAGRDLAAPTGRPGWTSSLMGAVELPPRDATVPMSRWSARSGGAAPRVPSPLQGLAREAPTLAVIALLAAACTALARRAARGRSGELSRGRSGGLSRGEVLAFAAVVTAAWAGMLANNAPVLYRVAGFDAIGHLEYVARVQETGALPLAPDGWEMYQPPLYYVLAAGLLEAFGLSARSDAGADLVRWVTAAAGVANALFALLSVRLVFPDSRRAQLLGGLLGAFLPAQLYVDQYVSNEGLAAALVSAGVWLTLVLLRRPDARAWEHLGLGAVLGLAMLAKFSALVALPVCLTVLAARGALERGVRVAAARAALALAGWLAVCGWHFGRVWVELGRPLVGNWDAESGFAWWQDPGYHVRGYYLGFGESLARPLFSAFHSFGDALYSTLWGDGLIGGSGSASWLPPWRAELMSAGYLLALVPTAALALGAGAALVRLVRRPRAEGFLLLGLPGAVLFAVVFMTLSLPYYAQARAIYGLATLVPIAVLGAGGLELLARRARVLAWAVPIAFGTWAGAAWWTFVAEADAPRNLAAYGSALLAEGRRDEAVPTLERAVAADPACADAWRGLALAWSDVPDGGARALDAARRATEIDATGADGHDLLGSVLYRVGRLEPAIVAARRALELDPDHPTAHANLALYLNAADRPAEAAAAYRDALRAVPDDPRYHRGLAELLRTLGQPALARRHDALARRAQGAVVPRRP